MVILHQVIVTDFVSYFRKHEEFTEFQLLKNRLFRSLRDLLIDIAQLKMCEFGRLDISS